VLIVVLLPQVVQKAADIQEAISEGANSFLFTEYKYMGIFMVSKLAQW
jgi:inorganic pyrophosphatase